MTKEVYVSEQSRKMSARELREINLVINRLGGIVATAKLLRCKHPPVCQWRQRGIPLQRIMYLQAVRPDVFEGTRFEVPKA